MTPSPRRWTRWRRCAQVAVALLFVALPFAGTSGIHGTMVSLGVGRVELVEPSAAASAVLAARRVPWPLLLAMAPAVALALVLGPVYCSWACPFGLVSELLDRGLRRRARWTGRPWATARRARRIALATVLGASALLGVPLAALLAPSRLATALPLEAWATRGVPALTAALLVLALVLEVAGPRRLVCRALCPAGAVAVLLRTPATLAPRLAADRCRCADPAPCVQGCPWGLDPRALRPHDGCTTCFACVERCPTGALTVLRRKAASAD